MLTATALTGRYNCSIKSGYKSSAIVYFEAFMFVRLTVEKTLAKEILAVQFSCKKMGGNDKNL